MAQVGEVVIIMGVSGCGKSTVGRAFADTTGFAFLDADDFHPASNIEKMKRGQPLTDEDRQPWLQALVDCLDRSCQAGENIVLACSALKNRYRDKLSSGVATPRYVFLEGSVALIEARLRMREGHFMPGGLLKSQFEALEVPEEAECVSIDQPVDAIVREIDRRLWPVGR